MPDYLFETSQEAFQTASTFVGRPWALVALENYKASVEEFRAINNEQLRHEYLLVAGTGSGKTDAAGALVQYLLGREFAAPRQVILVCPNEQVMNAAESKYREHFGIHLSEAKICGGRVLAPYGDQGYYLSYQKLCRKKNADAIRRQMEIPTVVVFDEVHHLADRNTWGQMAWEACAGAQYIINLSGSPFRTSHNEQIPFIRYEPIPGHENRKISMADHIYPLEKAVADGHCRRPKFEWYGGVVGLAREDGSEELVTFDDELSKQDSRRRHRAAVRYGSPCRIEMLSHALKLFRSEGRKVIVFLGGSRGSIEDGKCYLPDDLRRFGIDPDTEYLPLVGHWKKGAVQTALDHWCKSGQQWILGVDGRATEGTDIPIASAGIMLSSKRSALINIQRWGRLLRRQTCDSGAMLYARVASFKDPVIFKQGEAIEKACDHEIEEREKKAAASHPGMRRDQIDRALGDTKVIARTFKGHSWPEPIWREAERRLGSDFETLNELEAAVALTLISEGR